MNYKKIYDSIILYRMSNTYDGYTEKHHIIPRSLGGLDIESNIISVSAREHFILHLLLTKIYPEGSISWIKMCKALMRMYSISKYQYRLSSSKWYAYCKICASKANSMNQSGCGNSQYGKVWIYNEDLHKNKFIKDIEIDKWLKQGWKKGRILNWNTIRRKSKNGTFYSISKEYQKRITANSIRAKQRVEYNEKIYAEYYRIYNAYGWEQFKQQTGYKYSKSNLVMQFKKYVKDFVPQNGKKRGS